MIAVCSTFILVYSNRNVVADATQENYTISNMIKQFEEIEANGTEVTEEYIDSYFSHAEDKIFSTGAGYWTSKNPDSDFSDVPEAIKDGVDGSLNGPNSASVKDVKEALKKHFLEQ